MTRTHLLIFLSFCLIPSLFGQNCGCIPLLYEGFDYPESDNLHQKVGGTGWAGAWNSQVGDQRVGFRVGANTLTYNNLRSNYKSFVGGHYWHRIGRTLDVSPTGALAAYRKDNGYLGKAGTTLWTSAVFQKTQNNDEETWFGLHNSNVNWYEGNVGTTNSRLMFGYFGANSNANGVRYWTLRVGDSYYRTSIPIALASPTLAVMKLEFSENSTTINLYINPTTLGSGSPPSVSSLTLTTNTALAFQHFAVYGDNNTNNFILDEIRFSSNYTCVAPDATQSENLLPTARMTVSAITGIVPLTIQLNGTTSSDPDGTLNNYEWTFGDGGTRTGATTSYTFNNTGILYARLKVTDNCGSTNSATQDILVTNVAGQISCLSAPVPEAFPNCAGTGGGIIRMDVGLGTNFNLTNQNGSTYPYASSRFSNLPIGNYTLTVTGQSGCAETFDIKLPADSMNCPNVSAASGNALVFGMNLEGLAYWDKARPFKDFMKDGDSQWLTFTPNGSVWNTNVQNEIPMDTEGYPLAVPAMTSIGLQRVRFVFSAGGHLPIGDYLLLYDGEGDLYLRGAMTLSPTSTAGRKVFRVNGTDNLYLDIDYSNPNNHLRNFRLIRPQDEGTYLTQPFYLPFLEKTCLFNPIRFMDWQLTNGSPAVNWSERSKPNFRSQTTDKGVSYENIIQLGNTLNRDVWVCVPHQATDDYIRQMARLFRDNLNPGLHVFLEYSNEVWNWQFTQAHWVSDNGNQNISYPRRYVDKSLNAFKIWHEEWAGQTQRVKRVLGTQTGYNWISEQILAQAKGAFDYFAPAFYFGFSGTCLDNLRNLGANATPADVINCTRTSMRAFFPNISQTYRLAQLYGKPIAHYEGGSHMTSNPTIEPFQAALYQSQIDPLIKTLYQEMIDSLRRYGGTAYAAAFTLTGPRESRYGSWGHIEDIDQNLTTQPAPKYQVLLDNFRQNQGSCNLNLPILPVELVNFSGNTEGSCLAQKKTNEMACKHVLNWETATEVGTNTFELQQLNKDNAFETIATIKAQNKAAHYSFTNDKTSSRFVTSTTLIDYYRLKINDFDGKTTFSKTISLENGKILRGPKIYPNPATDVLTIENADGQAIEIVNVLGQVVLSVPTIDHYPLSIIHLKSGVYFVKTAGEVVRFVKN
jgi:chitodextrinase